MANLIDLVWSRMKNDELYSPRDLAESLGQPVDAIDRVLRFLVRYGFADQVTKHGPMVRKLAGVPDPAGTLRILQLLVEDTSMREPKRIAISNR